MSSIFKKSIKRVVRKIVDFTPSVLISNIVYYYPKMIKIIGPNKEVFTNRYLGNIRVRANIKHIVERSMLLGIYEPDSIAIFNEFIKKGDVCLDIGANVGALSLAMAQLVGNAGKVYSFEPGPTTYERLDYNIKLNKKFNNIIHTFNIGISDRERLMFWEEDINHPGNAMLQNFGKIEVPVVSIDEFFKNHFLSQLNFVKIDVEGMELEVLRGGTQTWKKHKPIFYFETLEPFRYRENGTSDRRDCFKEIESFFKTIHYSIYNIKNINQIFKTNYLNVSNNTIALKNETKI